MHSPATPLTTCRAHSEVVEFEQSVQPLLLEVKEDTKGAAALTLKRLEMSLDLLHRSRPEPLGKVAERNIHANHANQVPVFSLV